MFNYLIRRLIISVATLVVITFIIFGLIRNMPGDPTTLQFAEDPSRKVSEEEYARMRKAYGLDVPWPQAYVRWIANLTRGDLGRSFVYKTGVSTVIGDHIVPTLTLSITSMALAFVIAIPSGLMASARKGRVDERFLSMLFYMLYSFPSFVAALLLQYYLSVKLDLLPLYGMVSSSQQADFSVWDKIIDVAQHALMPTICYTYGSLAYYSRFVDANMQEVLRQDYIRSARAKGLGPMRVIVHHAFRNTLIPMVTLLGLTLPGLLSGAIIIERIFSWPGMGNLFFQSISARDYPTIMGLTLMFSVLTLLGQLFADLMYAVVDPRVRLS